MTGNSPFVFVAPTRSPTLATLTWIARTKMRRHPIKVVPWIAMGLGLVMALGSMSVGCGGGSGASGTGGTGGGVAGAGGIAGSSVNGMVNGRTFGTATTALWIGMPDANTPPVTVIYLFDMPVQCSAITTAGWDTTLGNTNQDLEMKAAGTTPGTYTVQGGNPTALAAGEAVVNYSVLMAAPAEQIASAGSTITLTAFNAGRNATGSFNITFTNGSLQGAFDATWCANGREP